MMQEVQSVQSLGVDRLFGDSFENANEVVLNPVEIQTCLIVINQFFNEIIEQGESKTVQDFKDLVLDGDFSAISSNEAHAELFNAVADRILQVLKQDDPCLMTPENSQMEDYVKNVLVPGILQAI